MLVGNIFKTDLTKQASNNSQDENLNFRVISSHTSEESLVNIGTLSSSNTLPTPPALSPNNLFDDLNDADESSGETDEETKMLTPILEQFSNAEPDLIPKPEGSQQELAASHGDEQEEEEIEEEEEDDSYELTAGQIFQTFTDGLTLFATGVVNTAQTALLSANEAGKTLQVAENVQFLSAQTKDVFLNLFNSEAEAATKTSMSAPTPSNSPRHKTRHLAHHKVS